MGCSSRYNASYRGRSYNVGQLNAMSNGCGSSRCGARSSKPKPKPTIKRDANLFTAMQQAAQNGAASCGGIQRDEAQTALAYATNGGKTPLTAQQKLALKDSLKLAWSNPKVKAEVEKIADGDAAALKKFLA